MPENRGGNTSKGFWAVFGQLQIEGKFLGLVKIATLTLAMAANPAVSRRYYWTGAFGNWYAVTAFHDHKEPEGKK